MLKRVLGWVLCLALCAACSVLERPAPPAEKTALKLKPASFSDLPGWGLDPAAYLGAANAFGQSCARIQKAGPAKSFGALPEAQTYGRWQQLCTAFAARISPDAFAIKNFFETNFRPYAVLAGNDPSGLFTGYYESTLHGSRTRSARYNIPLYTRPDDLVTVDLGLFRDTLKGQRIAGRVQNRALKPYEDRAAIVAGQWPHGDRVLVWVDSAIDAFFVQVQGSGTVLLDDGSVLRIGYDGQNGHVYTAIGRELIKRGALKQEEVSLQTIRAWLTAHPDQANDVMNTNRSYVFFKEAADGPKGAEGVTLTPGASLAVDHGVLPYGLPLWVDIDAPVAGDGPLRRLMVAQDTGGAITGPVRGDVFWGYGPEAERKAGLMKSKGRYWALLPVSR